MAIKKNGLSPKYFSSELDPISQLISQKNHEEIIPLGDITKIKEEDIKRIVPINLLIGGSPCTDLSIAKVDRQGLNGNTIVADL